MQTATANKSASPAMSDAERAEAWKQAWIAERRQNDQLKRLLTLAQWRLEVADSHLDHAFA